MEAGISRYISRIGIALSTILLAAVMLVCVPQGQAQAVETGDAGVSAAQTAVQEFTAVKDTRTPVAAAESDATAAAKQASGVKSKYGLLMKDGKLYPCSKKGKKLGTYWRVGSKVTYVFVAPNVKKYTGKWKVRYKAMFKLSNPVSYNIKTINFLTKKGKSSVKTIGKNSIDTTVTTVKNFNKTKVTTIGAGAFMSTKIKTLAFPKTLTTIGKNAFRSTSKLKCAIKLNKTKVKTIYSYAFAQSAIKSVSLPKTVRSIGENAFRQDKNLTKVSGLGSTKVQTIGNYAFEETALTSVSLPATLTTIKNEAFAYTKISSVTIPANCKTIGNYAFAMCPNLKTVTINNGSGVISAGSSLFLSSSGLTQIKVPASLVASYKSASNWSSYSSLISA